MLERHILFKNGLIMYFEEFFYRSSTKPRTYSILEPTVNSRYGMLCLNVCQSSLVKEGINNDGKANTGQKRPDDRFRGNF